MVYQTNFRCIARGISWGNPLNDANHQLESIFRAGFYLPITLISHIFVFRRMAGFWFILVSEHDACQSEQEADFFGTNN